MNSETREWADWVPRCILTSLNAFFHGGEEADLKNEEMQIICAWGGWLSGRFEGFLYHLQSGECADKVQIRLLFKISHTTENFLQAVEKWFETQSRLHTFYFRLKWKWNLKYIDSFSVMGTRGDYFQIWCRIWGTASCIRPIFLNLFMLVWLFVLTSIQPSSLTTQADLSSSSRAPWAFQGRDPKQEACKCFLMISCGLSVLPAVIVKGLFTIIVFWLSCVFLKYCLNNLHILW